MYHIKNDKRSIQSANIIYRSVRALARNKNLCDISITDIKEECGISRSTFYRNFDNVMDVLEWKLNEFYMEYLQKKPESGDMIKYFFTYWDLHSDFLYLITTQGEEMLRNVFKAHMKKTDDAFNDYLLSLQLSIRVSLLCRWVERHKKESIDEMVEITKKAFSLEYTKLLTEF